MSRVSALRAELVARSGRLTLAIAIAIAIAGCGSGHTQSHLQLPPPSHLQPPPQPPPAHAVAASHAPQLVSMRRIDGATYETVMVRADGTGEVGEFIGEWTGVVHQPFQVGARELGQLRHLVAIAERTRQTPAFGTSPSTEYIIFTRGRVLETAKGRVPRRLVGLTGILSGLIDRYS
jgi:hypothetical protein